jgi:excisionase family DNA binding protein
MPELLTISEVSAYLKVPVQTLRRWRAQGDGPPAAKLGKHLRYPKDGVDRWVAERQQHSTRGGGPAAGGERYPAREGDQE